MTLPLQLKDVRPDWDAMVQAFQSTLKSKDSWADLYEGSSGQTLIEYMAALGVYSQHSIEQLFLETFLTAKRDTSVYAIARMLGVRVSRKLSPQITVRFTRDSSTGPLVIPAWTQWNSTGSGKFVNVNPIIFDSNSFSTTAILYSGQVMGQSFSSNGAIFQELTITGSSAFSISDQHLEVRVDNRVWRIVYDGLWNYTSSDNVVVDNTNNLGSLILLFGDDVYGTSPNIGQTIDVKWIDTKGMSTTQLGSGLKVTGPISGVDGVTINGMSGGSDEKSPEFYRIMAPHIFQEKDKPVTTQGYTAKFLEYPGVLDARVLPQRDIGPYDLRLMNVMYVSLLIAKDGVWQREVDYPNPPDYLAVDDLILSLPAGTYSYRISAVNEVGESLANPATTFVISAPSMILLRWPLVENAVSYRVYGRTSGTEQYMDTVTPSEFDLALGSVHWIDDGTRVPSGAVPSANTTKANWWTFSKWADRYKHASIRLIQYNPVANSVDVNIVAYVKSHVEDLEDVRMRIYEAITSVFEPRLGTIGRKVALSDILTAAKVKSKIDPSTTDVDYVELLTPTVDQQPPTVTGYMHLNSLAISVVYTDRLNSWA